MDQTFKIGDIAAMCGVSIRAMRLYDRMGLLRPEHIDKESGYRYYTMDQVQTLNTILDLKGVGCTLAEISNLFASDTPQEDLSCLLDEKHEVFRVSITHARGKMRDITEMKTRLSLAQNSKQPTIPLTKEQRAHLLARLAGIGTSVPKDISDAIWL